jgi:predicted NACHT family NTPase
LVLVGDPGAGKSTFGRKLCHDLACGRVTIGGDATPTPILVVLRQYANEKAERPCSLLEYLGIVARTVLQLQVPAHAMEYLLLSGRLLVVFDGLDELPALQSRREVRSDVQHFSRHYPNVPTVVTSRRVGYEHAPLDDGRFDLVSLSHFDEDQIASYAGKWFALDRRRPKRSRQRSASPSCGKVVVS